jgi:hypothetical protein
MGLIFGECVEWTSVGDWKVWIVLKGQESVVELVRKEGRRRRGEEKKKERLGGLVFIGGKRGSE